MIPDMLVHAAHDGGWMFYERGRFRFTLKRRDIVIEGSRNLYRHTAGRAYNGNRLAAIFSTQREIAAYLRST